MEKLFELGINDIDIRNILTVCPKVMDMSNEQLIEKVNVLTKIGCKEEHIKNIIVSNPFYFDLLEEDVIELVERFKRLGIDDVDSLIDSYPLILNKEAFEIDEYINDRLENGENIEDIVEALESNVSIIDEI